MKEAGNGSKRLSLLQLASAFPFSEGSLCLGDSDLGGGGFLFLLLDIQKKEEG